MRHQRAAIRDGNGGDLKIIWSDRSAERFKMMATTEHTRTSRLASVNPLHDQGVTIAQEL
jgi:hypothetical protein